MTNYQIYSRKESHRLTVQSGIVTASTLEFLENLPWDTVRVLLNQKGWTIAPELDPVNVFEFKGHDYTIRWHGESINSITKDGEEIRWQDLPEQLKGLL